MPWYSRPSSRQNSGDTVLEQNGVLGSGASGPKFGKLPRTLTFGHGDLGEKVKNAAVSEFVVETLHASFDLVTPREAYNGQVVLKTKIELEDTEIWIRFAGYTKAEGKLLRFLEVDKLLRKVGTIPSGKRDTHMFALQFPATNLPPTCDRPYVHYELVSELRVNTGTGDQTVIRSKPHEIVFIPLLDPVLVQKPELTPVSPINSDTITISQGEIADNASPTPDNAKGKLSLVPSLRKATTSSFAPNALKRTETFRGLTKRAFTIMEPESKKPLLDLKLNVEDSEYRPGTTLRAAYRLGAEKTDTLPKSLTLSIVSKQYLTRNTKTLEPISQAEVVTKVLASTTLTPVPTQMVTLPIPDESAFRRKAHPFLPSAKLPFGTCTALDAPPGSSSSTSTSNKSLSSKGKSVVRNPTTEADLYFIIQHSVNLTAHFKGEPDHTIEVPIAIGNQKARKLKAPELTFTIYEGEGSSGNSSVIAGMGNGSSGKDVFKEVDVGWDGRGQFPTLETGGVPYYREDAADENEGILEEEPEVM